MGLEFNAAPLQIPEYLDFKGITTRKRTVLKNLPK
jgi:hypothetical protein